MVHSCGDSSEWVAMWLCKLSLPVHVFLHEVIPLCALSKVWSNYSPQVLLLYSWFFSKLVVSILALIEKLIRENDHLLWNRTMAFVNRRFHVKLWFYAIVSKERIIEVKVSWIQIIWIKQINIIYCYGKFGIDYDINGIWGLFKRNILLKSLEP